MKSDHLSRRCLEELGYTVNPIPTSDYDQKKEADFIVRYHDQTSIVEAKIKEDGPKEEEKKQNTLASDQVSVVEGKLGRNETISHILRSATKQLESSSDKKHDFKIIFFLATGSNAKTKADQCKDTIYGSTSIIHGNTQKPCYFYRNSDFYRRKTVDGAIIGHLNHNSISLELCLNPYSNNYIKLKVSRFIEPFGNAVIDPWEIERQGGAYIPDDEVNRKLEGVQLLSPMHNPILNHLREKYGTGFLIAADFDSPEISIRYNDQQEP